MEISASSMSLSSTQTKIQYYQREESLLITGPGQEGGHGGVRPAEEGSGQEKAGADSVSLSKGARRSMEACRSEASGEGEKGLMKDLNIRILKQLVERLTGKKIEISDVAKAYKKGGNSAEQHHAEAGAASAPAGWGVEYEASEVYAETETTTFEAGGQVVTADGQEIDISVSLSMSRQFVQKEHVHLQAGDAAVRDPLMVNFDGTSAQLSQKRFEFDIDCSGRSGQVSSPAPGTGFLALDRNQDGMINNGSELFGPSTGSGFEELAAYDEDGNNWIDESDSIYDKLRIWTRTPSGESRLFALGEKGVGAICLEHVSSSFDLTDSQNQLLGRVRETGVYLSENGSPGIIQELDLVV